MQKVKVSYIFFLLSFVIFQFSSVNAQNIFEGNFVLVQYIQEESGHRNVMHFGITPDGDTTGIYYELYREEGVPDSGTFVYYLNEDRTFIIPEDEGEIHGIIDDESEVMSFVRSDSTFALFAVGILRSSGKTVADLEGQYWVSEFFTEPGMQAVGLDWIDFDGVGTATLYGIENTVGETDTISFPYVVNDDGTLVFDDFLKGIMSPDGQVIVAGAGMSPEEDGNTMVIGIKKSTGLDNSALNGSYIYNEVETMDDYLDEESSFYGRVNLNGDGTGEMVSFLGEPGSQFIDYSIESDGFLEIDTTYGGVSSDGRYFLNVDLEDSTDVSFGLGIKGEYPVSDLEGIPEWTPSSFILEQNYPNPFNPSTLINYELRITSDVDLSIYNLLGQKVATLISEKQSAGSYQVEWDAAGFASGVYYYSLEAGEYRAFRKMILVR